MSLLSEKRKDPEHRKHFELFCLEAEMLVAMEKKGWRQADLARAMKTSKSAMTRDFRNDGFRKATVSRLQRMAQVLGMRLTFKLVEDK